MSSKYVIDAYAWIEYFRASEYGEVAKEYIESQIQSLQALLFPK